MNTAELPVLRETTGYAAPPAPSFTATRKRGHALANMGAAGWRYTFLCYDVVVSRGAIWIAQTDWLPENPGDYDYVAAEWPRVIDLARQWGYHDLGEPLYDTVEGVWVWAVPAVP